MGQGEMQLAEGIDLVYTFTCRVADTAKMAPIAETTIQVRQEYQPLDVLRILSVDPPTTQPLTPGSMQTFEAEVEYSLDAIRLGTQLMLVARDSSGTELVPRNAQRRNPSSQGITRTGPTPMTTELSLTDVPVPEDGFVSLHAEQVNFRQVIIAVLVVQVGQFIQ